MPKISKVIDLLKITPDRVFKLLNLILISRPHWTLLIIEFVFLFGMIFCNGILTWGSLYYGIGFGLAIWKICCFHNVDYGGILEQFNNTEGKGNKYTRKHLNKCYFGYFGYLVYLFYFIILYVVYGNYLTLSHDIANIWGCFISFFILVCEAMIFLTAVSPFLFFFLILVFSTILGSIGSESSILNLTFLLLFFETIIGSNFFDKSLVKGRFSKRIGEKNLILRKISYYIGLIFLYLAVFLSESILKSTYYYVHITQENPSVIVFLQNLVLKFSIYLLLYYIYLETEKKIMYLIFRFYYRDKTLKNSGSVVKISLDEEKRWEVKRVKKTPKDIERIGINTYKLKKHDVIYVDKNSEIPEKIKGLREADGKRILGLVPFSTKVLLLLTIAILPVIYFLDNGVKVNNGIYRIYSNSDNIDSSDTIEISDDTIIYNGKAEHFDTRKQSFSMGKVKKNDSNNITVKFYITGKEVQYKKKSGYSGSW